MSNNIYKHGVNVREFNEQHWEFVGNFAKEEYDERGLSCSNARGWYRCRHCGAKVGRTKNIFKTKLFICPNECNGVRHGNSSSITLKGINDIATTHPHLVKYFIDKEEVCRYSVGSNQKIKLNCPDCRTVKEMSLNTLSKHAFACPICSDGISFPEKFVANLLKHLRIEFKKEYTLDNKTRYDFYLPEYNCIIEVHGIQHYEQTRRRGARTLAEEQANDGYKYELAVGNGIKHYIVIDARESSLEWMKAKVLNSSLSSLLDFDEGDIDWNSVATSCEKSLVKEVCDYFNEHGGSTYSISDAFDVSPATVNKYLKRGTELGWCKYTDEVKQKNSKEACRQNGLALGKRVRGVSIETGEVVEFSSAKEAGRWLGIEKQSHISSCCNGKRKSAYGYRWSYVN